MMRQTGQSSCVDVGSPESWRRSADHKAEALHLDTTGWLIPRDGVAHAPSPNADARPDDDAISLLVIHNISLPPGQFGGPEIIDLFLNRLDVSAHPWLERLHGLRVSAHFLIRRDGGIIQFVSCQQRAWHAGASCFDGRHACNDFSIGIELEGTDTQPFEDVQYAALRRLTRTLRAHYPLNAVRGHEHVAPGRKTDPGPAFDWARYGRDGGWLRAQMP